MLKASSALRNINYPALIFAVAVFLQMLPFFIWSQAANIQVITGLIILFISFFKVDFSKKTIPVIALFFLSYSVLGLVRGTKLGGQLILFSCAIIPCLKKSFVFDIYKYFKLIVIIFYTGSIINLILVTIGVPLTPKLITPVNELKQYSYASYPCLVIPIDPTYDFSYVRFCSVFDEPGVVGTLSALLLMIEGFSMKNRSNIILLIAGLLSFSLFFYAMIFIYLIILLPVKWKIGLTATILIFFSLTKNSEFVKSKLWDRTLGINQNNAGSTRNSDDLIADYKSTIGTYDFYFGKGATYTEKYSESASIQLFILRDGFLFVFLFFVSFFFDGLNNMSVKSTLFFILIMFLTLWQRPGFCGKDYLLMFTSYVFFHVPLKINLGK